MQNETKPPCSERWRLTTKSNWHSKQGDSWHNLTMKCIREVNNLVIQQIKSDGEGCSEYVSSIRNLQLQLPIGNCSTKNFNALLNNGIKQIIYQFQKIGKVLEIISTGTYSLILKSQSGLQKHLAFLLQLWCPVSMLVNFPLVRFL